eukprot:4725581-Amphidinium_carterae.1
MSPTRFESYGRACPQRRKSPFASNPVYLLVSWPVCWQQLAIEYRTEFNDLFQSASAPNQL